MDSVSAHVLVVDDEKNVRLTLRQALEDLGLAVETATEGTEALAHLEENDCDLMLLDLRMPGLSGMETLEHTRRLHPDVPVVVITAHGTVKNAVQAVRRGAVDVLLKPISLDALRTLIAQIFRKPSSSPDATPYDAWMQLAAWHLRRQRTAAARHCLHEALNQDETRAAAHTLLGVLEGAASDTETARHHLQAAVAQDAESTMAQILLDRLQEDGSFPINRPASLLASPDSPPTDPAPSNVRTAPSRAESEDDMPYRVCAVLGESVADGPTAAHRALAELAADSARSHASGEVLLLTTLEVPQQLTLSQAEDVNQKRTQEATWQLEALAETLGEGSLRVHPLVVIAHQAAAVVENTVTHQAVQHLVGQWPGTHGTTVDMDSGWTDALNPVSCEVTLLRPGATPQASGNVTAFITDSPHAPFVARRAREWAQGRGVARLTLLTIQYDDGTLNAEALKHRGQRLLWDIADRAGLEDEQYNGRVLVSKDVQATANRCASACDRICIGAGQTGSWAEPAADSFAGRLAGATEAHIALVRGAHFASRPSFLEALRNRLSGGE